MEWIAKNMPPDLDDQTAESTLNVYGLDPSLIREKLPEIPAGAFRDLLIGELARSVAKESHAEAVRFLKSENASSEDLDYHYSQWASKEPKAALTSLTDDQETRPEIWASVVEKTILSAPEETVAALEELPAGRPRDLSLGAIARVLQEQSGPLAATEWILGMTDETLRQESFDELLNFTALDLSTERQDL